MKLGEIYIYICVNVHVGYYDEYDQQFVYKFAPGMLLWNTAHKSDIFTIWYNKCDEVFKEFGVKKFLFLVLLSFRNPTW